MHSKRKHLCEAQVHAPDCNGLAYSKDHFTPPKIARLMGWEFGTWGRGDNIQWLSDPCHKLKDQTTPLRLAILE